MNSLKEEKSGNGQGQGRFVYSKAPFLIYWEMTRACDLVCRHCRAEAIDRRDPGELNTSMAEQLLERIRTFGERSPHLVFTGGDPLKRPDLFDLLEYGSRLGLRMSVAPSATNGLTREVLRNFRNRGVESISLSLDGPSPEKHDGFRGVPGCFARTIQAAHLAREEGLDLQVKTLVTADTEADLPEIYRLVSGFGTMRWSLFFLIQVGRGEGLRELTPDQCEALHQRLYDLSKESPFAIATTEAPHYRRVAFIKMRAEGIPSAKIQKTPVGRGFGIRDGNGVMFISHTGDVYPSGFLSLVAGNVRTGHIVDIYRDSETFRKLRQTTLFKGKCGYCEFREICGGSRARAYARHGDPLETDPLCAYEPVQRGVKNIFEEVSNN